MPHEEYLRRNLVHASAVGVHANVRHIAEKLRTLKRPPKWLLLELERTAPRAEAAHRELAKWRDAAPDKPTPRELANIRTGGGIDGKEA